MSSHREAPEISKDPVADSTDLYAFVSPDESDTVTIIANYVPLAGPGRRTELLRVRRRRPVRDQHRQRRRRRRRHHVRVQLHDRDRRSAARSSTTSGRSRRSTRPTGTGASSTVTRVDWEITTARSRNGHDNGAPGARRARPAARRATSGRVRRPNYSASRTPRSTTARRRQGLRRPARRGLLRRPRLDLRPRRAAPGPERCTSSRSPGSAGRGQRHQGAQRPHDRDADPKTRAHHATERADRPARTRVGHRRVDDGAASAGALQLRHARTTTPRTSGPWTQVSRLGNPLFNEVLVPMERKDDWNHEPPHERQRVRRRRAASRAGQAAAGALPGRVPEPGRAGRVGQAPRRPRRDPADRDPAGHHPRLPELHGRDPGRPAAAEHGDPAERPRRTTSAWWAATSPASPTGGASPTTSSRSS